MAQEWLAILPDNAGALAKRNEVRAKHLEGVKPDVAAGRAVLGGAMLAEPLQEGQEAKMTGSVLMMVADTEEEVRQRIERDIYYTSGVWDASKVQIIPFRSAVRKAL